MTLIFEITAAIILARLILAFINGAIGADY